MYNDGCLVYLVNAHLIFIYFERKETNKKKYRSTYNKKNNL